jgi:copper transport protein
VFAQSAPMSPEYPLPAAWRVITEVAYFVGLFGVLGATSLHLLVLRPVLRRADVSAADRGVLRRRSDLVLGVAGAWFLVALYFQLAGKAARVKGHPLRYADALAPDRIWAYLRTPATPPAWVSTGTLTLVQFALGGVAALLLITLLGKGKRDRTTGTALAALVVAVAAQQVTLVPADPAGQTAFDVVDLLSNHVHVLAAGVWTGGIGALIGLVGARRRLSERAGAAWGRIWARFSTVALAGVGALLISGLFLAYGEVGGPGELLTTTYGVVLLVKVSLVALMIVLGAANEFLLMPRIARARAAGADASVFRLALRVFPALVAVELGLAVAVLVVLTFLSGSARSAAGDDDPALSGGVLGLGVLLVAAVAAAFVTTAKVSGRLARPALPTPPAP